MTDSVIAGTEITLTASVDEDGTLVVVWDQLPTKFLFHEGFAAILRKGSGETEGLVELQRMPVDIDVERAGHIEPLLSD